MRNREKNHKNSGIKIGIILGVLTIMVGIILLYIYRNQQIDDENIDKMYLDLRNLVFDTQISYDDSEYNENEDVIDWKSINNPNVVGWIKYGPIDYPIMQADDNSYYLDHAFDGSYNRNGSIFVSCFNNKDFTDNNTIIYGHNLRSGRMFGRLEDIIYHTEYYPKELYIYLPDGTKHIYDVYSINRVKYNDAVYQYSFATHSDYMNLLTSLSDKSLYDYGIFPNSNRKIVTLSTCSSYGSSIGNRIVLVAIESGVQKIQNNLIE